MKEIEITTRVIPDIEISSQTQEMEEFILQVEEQKQVEITVK